MSPNKIKTFICKRCSLENEGHYNTKYCDICISTSYKCSCSLECSVMISAYGDRKSGFTFPERASQHSIRTFICTTCKGSCEQRGWGASKEVCDSCRNQLNPCKCGCGKFVKAGHYNRQFISGHNIFLIPHEILKERQQKSVIVKKTSGNPWHSSETKKKISKTVARHHKEGKYKGTHGQNHSKGERSLKPYLEPLGYIHSEDKNLRISNGFRTRYPDYYNPETKKIVEYFGTYWHRDRMLPKGQKHKTPQQVIDWYYKQGWDCIVVWENEEQDFINSFELSANLGGF